MVVTRPGWATCRADTFTETSSEGPSASHAPRPLRRVPARVADDPAVDRDRQATSARRVEKVRGHKDAVLRMLPAQQRLESRQRRQIEVDDGLVAEVQLAPEETGVLPSASASAPC